VLAGVPAVSAPVMGMLHFAVWSFVQHPPLPTPTTINILETLHVFLTSSFLLTMADSMFFKLV